MEAFKTELMKFMKVAKVVTKGFWGVELKAKADLLPHPPRPPPPHHHQSWMTRGLRLGLRWRQRQS